PAAIITATGRNPETAGAVYPFPMIEDGDFAIPVVYTTDTLGEELAALAGSSVELVSDARRRPARGVNVVARRGCTDGPRIVVCAHIDTKIGTPGALDNAAGTTVLLLLAQRLRDYDGTPTVEIVALNGEENYAVPGQMLYLERNRERMEQIVVAVNLDALGLRGSATAFSLYECPDPLAATVRAAFGAQGGLVEGTPWPQGDHMVFAMNGRPAVALASDRLTHILQELAHTERDTPDLLDYGTLDTAADALAGLIAALRR
ncbi:MAG: M28 family peptidase, partial [Chitinivibrionales bacterium]|nr:M28 family peptidase [Chitinivibrionales bacterium]